MQRGNVNIGALEARAWFAIAALGLCILTAGYSLLATADQLDILQRLMDGGRLPYADVVDSDQRIDDAWKLQLGAGALAAVAWLIWQSLAYRSELSIGVRDPRFPPRDAILWWFIPFVFVIKAKQVMNDVWRGSDPELGPHEPEFRSRPVDPLVNVWWLIWIASTVLNRVVKMGADDVGTPEEAESAMRNYMVSEIGMMLAAALAMIVVFRITQRVGERAARHRRDVRPASVIAPATAGGGPAVGGGYPGGSVGPPGS
jgi:hypothetical protein